MHDENTLYSYYAVCTQAGMPNQISTNWYLSVSLLVNQNGRGLQTRSGFAVCTVTSQGSSLKPLIWMSKYSSLQDLATLEPVSEIMSLHTHSIAIWRTGARAAS
jgi:hypothetical protein